MFGIEFKRAYLTFLIVLLPVIVAVLGVLAFEITRGVRGAFGSMIGAHVFTKKQRLIVLLLEIVIVSTAAIALSGPVVGKEQEIEYRKIVSAIFVFDVSKSMLVQDMPEKAQRIEWVCNSFERIIKKYTGSKLGFILFAGSSHGYWPSTDTQAQIYLAENVCYVNAVPGDGSNIVEALGKALEMAKAEEISTVFLLSDGGETEDANNSELQDIISEYKKAEIRIFSLGIGTARGGRVPIFDSLGRLVNYQKKGSEYIVSVLNEGRLKRISASTGGWYKRAEDPSDIFEIVDKGAVFTTVTDSTEVAEGSDIYYVFLAASLAAMVFYILYPRGLKG